MDSRQYGWTVRNKYSYSGPIELGASGIDRLLRNSARDAGNLSRASAAWQNASDAELQDVSSVEAFKEGCLTVRVNEETMLHHARVGAGQLRRALRVQLPALRSLRFLGPAEEPSDVSRGAQHD